MEEHYRKYRRNGRAVKGRDTEIEVEWKVEYNRRFTWESQVLSPSLLTSCFFKKTKSNVRLSQIVRLPLSNYL